MSADRLHAYKLLAELLEYPTPRTATTARLCARFLEERCPAAAEQAREVDRAFDGVDVRDLEERYAAIFDFHPSRTMDLGYQLFGETYKRGTFLVRMKEATVAHDIDPGTELPDHLPVVLRLLTELSPEEEPKDLVQEVILPSVEKILLTFEDDGAGYRAALSAVKSLLMTDYGIDHVELPKVAEDSLASSSSTGRKLPLFPGFNPPFERAVS